MNYRRGFQRVYALLVVLWIAFVLLATQSGKWRPWPYMPRAQWEIDAEKAVIPPPLPRSAANTNEPVFNVSPEQFLRDAAHQEERHRAIIRWSWVIGFALLPPIFGYLLLFYVTPWIYQGFTQL
jgi:hypothetical protein